MHYKDHSKNYIVSYILRQTQHLLSIFLIGLDIQNHYWFITLITTKRIC